MSPRAPNTICIDCRHHNGAKTKDAWHAHLCLHPDHALPEVIDPVTGVIRFEAKNELGKTIYVDNSCPPCRDVNNGNCPLFEPK